MRKAFWTIGALSFLLLMFGAFGVDVPWKNDVPKSTTRDWYATATIGSVIAGALIGLGIGLLWIRSTPHLMRESGMDYLDRVAGRSVWSVQVGGFFVLVALIIGLAATASQNELELMGTGARVQFLVMHGKLLQPLFAGVLAASAACTLATLITVWSGQYALTPFPKQVEV